MKLPLPNGSSWEADQYVRVCSQGHIEAAVKGDAFRDLQCKLCGNKMYWKKRATFKKDS